MPPSTMWGRGCSPAPCRATWTREAHVAIRDSAEPLVEAVNTLLASAAGRRDRPLRVFRRGVLFSVAARRGFVPPDLALLPGAC